MLDADGLLPDGVVTDADGRFRIAGLGRDVVAQPDALGPDDRAQESESHHASDGSCQRRAARSAVPGPG